MTGPSTPSRIGLRVEAFYLALVAAVCAHFSLFFATRNAYYIDLVKYTEGHERLPYQFRALSAWVGSLIAGGLHMVEPAIAALPAPFNDRFTLAFLLINILSLTIATLATRRSIARLTGDPGFARFASFLVPLMAAYNYLLIVSMWKPSHPYDLPQLALFSLCVNAIIENRIVPFYFFFLLANLNRETALFIVPLFVLWHTSAGLDAAMRATSGNFPRRLRAFASAILSPRLLPHVALQIGIFAAARALVFTLYKGNPQENGVFVLGLFSMQFFEHNLHFLANPIYWPGIWSTFAFLWIPLWLGFKFLDHPGLRWSLLIVGPWVLTMLLVGQVVETRVFGELISLVAPCVAVIGFNYLKQPAKAREGS